jgi:hypothetical protein
LFEFKFCAYYKFVQIQNLFILEFCSDSKLFGFKIGSNSKFVWIWNLFKFKICSNSKFVPIRNLFKI